MINKSSLLAIRALTELATLPSGEFEGAASIAKKIKAPANYLGKILQSIATGGLIISQKGKGGGFRLKKSPDKITLYDIVSSVEDADKLAKCFLGRKQCLDSSPCSVHDRWKQVKAVNQRFLKEITLEELSK